MLNLSMFVSEDNFQKQTGVENLEVKNLISEESFRTLISVERKRTERSGKPFMVMLLDVSVFSGKFNRNFIDKAAQQLYFNKVSQALTEVTRDIDIKGWYENGKAIGILYTEISTDGVNKIVQKVQECLQKKIDMEYASKITMSCHWYPTDDTLTSNDTKQIFYHDIARLSANKKMGSVIKRSIDLFGSLFGLLIFSPVFIFASILIKLTSKGPVFFRQERVGKGGKVFKIYKFRTMTVSNDVSQHREYMKQFINGTAEAVADETGQKVFKLTNDARITSIGKILRKTSLDEVPQFINVLLGDMSMVGPRPPIPYEVEEYDLWHQRRVLEVKPGITGYWQVEGRSTTSFEGMVRMDIRYSKQQSPLLDMKVILKTPIVLFKGAY